jgi:hypothetical protein
MVAGKMLPELVEWNMWKVVKHLLLDQILEITSGVGLMRSLLLLVVDQLGLPLTLLDKASAMVIFVLSDSVLMETHMESMVVILPTLLGTVRDKVPETIGFAFMQPLVTGLRQLLAVLISTSRLREHSQRMTLPKVNKLLMTNQVKLRIPIPVW